MARHLAGPVHRRNAVLVSGSRNGAACAECQESPPRTTGHRRSGIAQTAAPLYYRYTDWATSLPRSIHFLVFPGMVARLLFEWCRADPSGASFPAWCSTSLDASHEANKAYPLLVLHEFPHGVKGLMIASFLAAMMSSLSSLFNSVSAMFTYDIYGRCLCHTGQSHLSHYLLQSHQL